MEILIADDNMKVRSALRLLLEQDTLPMTVVEISELQDIFNRLREKCPSVILLDWELPDLHGKDGLGLLYSCCPEVKIIAMSSRHEARHEALAAGVDAFISKSEPPEKILATIYGQFSQFSRCSSSSQRL